HKRPNQCTSPNEPAVGVPAAFGPPPGDCQKHNGRPANGEKQHRVQERIAPQQQSAVRVQVYIFPAAENGVPLRSDAGNSCKNAASCPPNQQSMMNGSKDNASRQAVTRSVRDRTPMCFTVKTSPVT